MEAEMEFRSVDECPHFRMKDIDVKSLDIRELMNCSLNSMDTTEDAEKFVNDFWEKAREIESEELEKKVLKRKAEKCRHESSRDAFSKIQASSNSNHGPPHPSSSRKGKYELRSQKIAKSDPLTQYKSSPDTSRDNIDNEETEAAKVNHEMTGNVDDGNDVKEGVVEFLEKARGIGIESKKTGKVKKIKKCGQKLNASLPKLRSGRCGRSETSANAASSTSALTRIQASFPCTLRSNCSQVPSPEGGEEKIVKSRRLALSQSSPRCSFGQRSSSKTDEIAEKFRAIWTAIKK